MTALFNSDGIKHSSHSTIAAFLLRLSFSTKVRAYSLVSTRSETLNAILYPSIPPPFL